MSYIRHTHYRTPYFLDFPHALDPAFGPSPHARFETGGGVGGAVVGCDCRKETFHISYDETKKELQNANPHLPSHELRILTAQTFRPRYREDIASVRNEEEGKSTELTLEVTAQGDFFYPTYGRTDTEMDNNAKHFNPSEYQPTDTLTNNAVHEAFAQGATRVITSYYRPGQDQRDFVEFTIDPLTRKGKLRMINAGTLTGKTQDFQKMNGLAAGIFSSLHVYNPSDRVFVATDKKINSSKLERDLHQKELQAQQTPRPPSVADNVVRDTLVTTQTLLDYLRDRKEQQEDLVKAPITLSNLLTEDKHTEAMLVLETTPTGNKKESLEQDWKEKAQRVLKISADESEALLEEVVETHQMMADIKTVISFATDTGVGVGVALYALDLMVLNAGIEHMPEPQLVETPVLSEEQKETVFSFFVPAYKNFSEAISMGEEKMLDIAVDRETLKKTIEFVRTIDALPASEKKQKIIEEKEHVTQRMEFLFEIVGEIARSGENTTEAKGDQAEQIFVEQFSLALAVWMLLKLTQYYSALEGLEKFVQKKERQSLLVAIQKEKPEGLIQKEPSPWILLSIIWYLAQIREQGLAAHTATPKKKTKSKKVFFTHAPTVIFAYGS